jgi:hypothetical protein
MHVDRLGRGELVAAVGSILLAAGLFLPWYETAPDNPNAVIDGARGALSGWEVHTTARWLLLAAASAPLILIWIVIRDHELSWPRGEMTAVVAIAALGLVGYNGIIDRPGEPKGLIGIQWGFAVAMVGILLMVGGSALRASEVERKRKPPGVL